jgi:hypothetical protein
MKLFNNWGKGYKVKKCPRCDGLGLVPLTFVKTNPVGKIIDSGNGYDFCRGCHGTGITGVPELEDLSENAIRKLCQDRSSEDLINLFNNKIHDEIVDTLKELG